MIRTTVCPDEGEPILPESHIDRSMNAPGAVAYDDIDSLERQL